MSQTKNRLSAKLRCLGLCLILLASLILTVFAVTAPETPEMTMPSQVDEPVPDMTLTAEQGRKALVLDHYFFSASAEKAAAETTDGNAIPEGVLPSGANFLSAYVFRDNIVFIDYRLDGVRYIVEYFKNGDIRKTARAVDGELIYTASTFSETVEVHSVEENVTEYALSEAEVNARQAQMKEEGWDAGSAYPITGDISG